MICLSNINFGRPVYREQIHKKKVSRIPAREDTGSPHLRLHHVDSLRPELADAIEDVHHAFVLGHVQHDVHSNEAACPARTSAVAKKQQRDRL